MQNDNLIRTHGFKYLWNGKKPKEWERYHYYSDDCWPFGLFVTCILAVLAIGLLIFAVGRLL